MASSVVAWLPGMANIVPLLELSTASSIFICGEDYVRVCLLSIYQWFLTVVVDPCFLCEELTELSSIWFSRYIISSTSVTRWRSCFIKGSLDVKNAIKATTLDWRVFELVVIWRFCIRTRQVVLMPPTAVHSIHF